MFIISEISPQFGPDLEIAEQMIMQSKMGGAKAVKLQLYPADLFSKEPSQYLRSRELTFDSFKRLFDYGRSINIPVFATAFTEDRLEWCKDVGQEYYKVAARMHLENPDLVKKICSTEKRVFVSVPHDMDVSGFESKPNLIYMHCVVKYPTLLEQVELPDFDNSIFKGFSDHSIGVGAAIYAAAKGCGYLEKHFTISHSWQRSDEKAHLGAMDFEQLSMISKITRDIETLRAVPQ